jgi:hypothetical protein
MGGGGDGGGGGIAQIDEGVVLAGCHCRLSKIYRVLCKEKALFDESAFGSAMESFIVLSSKPGRLEMLFVRHKRCLVVWIMVQTAFRGSWSLSDFCVDVTGVCGRLW